MINPADKLITKVATSLHTDNCHPMVAALKKRGIETEYMVKKDEGHGFHNQNNRFDFYGSMEKFLATYLKK